MIKPLFEISLGQDAHLTQTSFRHRDLCRYWRGPAARQCLPSWVLAEDERTRRSRAERAMTPLSGCSLNRLSRLLPLRIRRQPAIPK